MSAPTEIAVQAIPLTAITVPSGRRPLSGVESLAASIREIGLLNPISLTADHTLVGGYHRLEAARLLGWDTIPARVFPFSAEDARLGEIDENLIRNELTVLERGVLFMERETILESRGQRATVGRPGNGETVSPLLTTPEIAAQIGVGERSYQQHKQIAKRISAEVQEQIAALPVADHTRDLLDLARTAPAEQAAIAEVLVRGDVETVREARQVLRHERRAERDAMLDAPPIENSTGPFDVIYADPPWRYEHVRTESRAIENQYPTMPLGEICALPIPAIAAEDCVLFLWATSPKLAEAFQVLESWGFSYRTCAVWAKPQIGMGYYFRQQHELLLVAIKGAPHAPAEDARPGSVVNAPRQEHSAKPAIFRELLERMYPAARKVELFARERQAGWAAWGNQA